MMTRSLLGFLGVLLIATICGWPVPAQARGQKFAVLVGINNAINYQVLQSSEADASQMSQLLTKRGFNATSLLLGEQATRANILRELNNALGKAGSGDLFVFYFSGHGTLFDDAKSLFRDENIRLKRPDNTVGFSDSALVTYNSAQNQDRRAWGDLILDDELYNLFADFAARGCYVMLIADACNSGTLSKGTDFSLSEPSPTNQSVTKGVPLTVALNGLDKLDAWPVTPYCNDLEKPIRTGYYLALTASADDQQAVELAYEVGGYYKRASVFTRFLLQEAKDASHTYASLYEAVRERTMNELKQRRDFQEPQLDYQRFGSSNWLDVGFLNIPDAGRPVSVIPPSRCVPLVLTTTERGSARPLADCLIEIFSAGDVIKSYQTALLRGRTNRQGDFVSDTDITSLPPGRYLFQLSRPGYQPYRVELAVTADRSGRFESEFQLARATR